MVLRRACAAMVAALLFGACGSSYGPWTDPSGNIASGGIIVEYEGFNRCGTQDVVFITYVGRTYANDPAGALGVLMGRTGEELTFLDQAELPSDASPSGLRHNIREVWVAESDLDDYLYLVYDDERIERWPRAEIPCK